MGILNVPLKAVLPFYAQAANHPLPGDLRYADGLTLLGGTHSIDGGSSNYVLPDLRNMFVIGADLTKALLEGGQYISFVSNMTASPNSYDYQIIGGNPNYVVQSGDYLTYDVYWPSANIPSSGGGCGAVDLIFADVTAMRSSPPNDQNGLSGHPSTDLRSYALNLWYRRRLSLASFVGKTISGFALAHEYDGTYSGLTTRFQNLTITDSTGLIVKFKAWMAGDGSPPSYTADIVGSATFVSGNASTFGAPGPNGWSGSHSQIIKAHNIPSHNHTGSTTPDGDHTHTVSITGHSSHTHSPTGGNSFVLDISTTWARTGATYNTITCTMLTSAAGGSHSHTVSPINDGSHPHNITLSGTSSGGTNATQDLFDPRPRYYGMVWTLKAGGSSRLLSVPMGTVVMFYADLINEALPNGMSYCDGSSLTSGNHSVPNSSGSLNYTLVLPDLRNRFLIGADRTKSFGAAGTTSDGWDGAPGPGKTGGVHSFSIGVANLPDHTHAVSTDTQWATHNHTWTVAANASHTHATPIGGYYLTSGNGGTEITGTGGVIVDEPKSETRTTTTTTSDVSHSHTLTIGLSGTHSHNPITVASTGSGSTWDNRSQFIGVVYVMKTTVGLTSVPLKTIIATRATATGEVVVPVLSGEWVQCDGSTLTPGQFDMTANSGSNYVLPDFKRFFPLGADRTKAAGNTGGLTDTAADAPGPKGTAGSATFTLTTSLMPAHIHGASSDNQGSHNHGASVTTATDPGHSHTTGCHTYWLTTSGTIYHTTGQTTYDTRPPAVDTYSSTLASATQGAHTPSVVTAGVHTHVVTISNTGAGSAFHQRPRFHGLIFFMKVKR